MSFFSRFFILISFLCAASVNANQLDASMPKATLRIQKSQWKVWLAQTPAQQAYGLMGQKSLTDAQGMLFIFDQAKSICFWMKNTPTPLSIAFVNQDKKITQIQDMQANTLDSHCAPDDTLWALEVKQGAFDRRKVYVGDVLEWVE